MKIIKSDNRLRGPGLTTEYPTTEDPRDEHSVSIMSYHLTRKIQKLVGKPANTCRTHGFARILSQELDDTPEEMCMDHT